MTTPVTPEQATFIAGFLSTSPVASNAIYSLTSQIQSLTKERDELRLQIDIQAGSIEAVQAANQRLVIERDELMAALETLHKHASEEFAATPKLGNACLTAGWQIAALKKAGVQ